jgi:hypothetical protein
MSLAEGTQAFITSKKYASAAITSNALAVSSSDLVATGGQILRRVSSTLKFTRANYQSNEILASRQVQDMRLGKGDVQGNAVSGEWSPGSYFDYMEAACRGTRAAATALSNTDLTSAAFDSSGSTVTFASGDPVALGLRNGDIVNFTNLATAGNDNVNFLILSFGGTSNRTVTIYPAPITESADTTFNVTTVGKSVFIPATGHVSRKFGFEIYDPDIDLSRLYTECRVGGFSLKLPATGMSTVDIPVMGRWLEVNSGGGAFFSSPTAATTTGNFAAVNGVLYVGGSKVGVVTGLNIDLKMAMTGDAVVGQNFSPEIFLGKAAVSGTATALLQDGTYLNDFKNETEISILTYLTTTSAVNSPAATIYLPRIKLTDADVATSGEGGQILTLPFTALKADGTVHGDEATTIRITDTAAS